MSYEYIASRLRTERSGAVNDFDGVVQIGIRLKLFVSAVAAVAALALPAGALAQAGSPATDQYDPGCCSITGGGGSDPSASGAVGGLPFTGFEVGMMAVAAVGLAGAGLALRRRSGHAEEGT